MDDDPLLVFLFPCVTANAVFLVLVRDLDAGFLCGLTSCGDSSDEDDAVLDDELNTGLVVRGFTALIVSCDRAPTFVDLAASRSVGAFRLPSFFLRCIIAFPDVCGLQYEQLDLFCVRGCVHVVGFRTEVGHFRLDIGRLATVAADAGSTSAIICNESSTVHKRVFSDVQQVALARSSADEGSSFLSSSETASISTSRSTFGNS